MKNFDEIQSDLIENPRTWLVTGAAGFIGSNLVEKLVSLNQIVVGFDNFSTGKKLNLESIKKSVEGTKYKNFHFQEGDIRNLEDLKGIFKSNIDYVLHQAALGSVPRSVEDPFLSHDSNVTGFLNMLICTKENDVSRLVYASSSSVYGSSKELPKQEELIGDPLSPYAATKLFNEVYAKVFSNTYGIKTTGLRYFNVFGKRQDPFGAYAAVIPLWVKSMINNEDVFINGDGETSRDFCYIENVVQANIMAALQTPSDFEVYNVALGDQTTLLELFKALKDSLKVNCNIAYSKEPIFRDFRKGDVRHSLASTSKIVSEIGYEPKFRVSEGIHKTIQWYVDNL